MSIQKVNQYRAATAAKRAEREAAESAPLSRAERQAAVDRQLSGERVTIAERGLARRVDIAGYEYDDVLFADVSADGRVNLLPPLVALFGADTVRALLTRFIDQAPEGPSAADRKAKLAAIDAELLELETAEERAIRALEASGVEVIRRADASPAVVLADT